MIATDLHADTLALISVLQSAPHGEVIPLARFSTAIGRDIRQCRHLLYSAIRVMERDHCAVFASVRGEGYRRMASDEIVKIGQTARSRIRRTARRGSKSIAAGMAGANDLSNEARIKLLAEQSALGVLEHLARDKSLPTMPQDATRPLPVAVSAREFLKAIGAKVEA